TGSAGTTSTRLALALILASKGKVKHSAHANSESGIPLNILGLKPISYSPLDWLRMLILAPFMLIVNWEHFDYYIVEMGIDSPRSPKNMSFLLSVLRPHVAIVLNAGLVHGGAFDYLVKDRNPSRRAEKIINEIAKEKMKLARAIDPTGVAIINQDQKELLSQIGLVKARVLTVGKSTKASFRILKVNQMKRGFSLSFSYQNQEYALHLNSLFPSPFAHTFSFAIAASIALGVTPAAAITALKKYHSPRGRLRLFDGINSTQLLDSSYNASPLAMQENLALLTKLAGRHHRLAILGDMRELGFQTKLAHKQLADWIMKYSDEVLLFGSDVKLYTLPVLVAKHFPARHFTNMSDLINYAQTNLPPGSYVLIKGSQNTLFLERAVEALLANQKDARELCRRGPYWDKLRSQAP
ncbi:MAG: Mur ligase family protein, partial [bacterium]